VKRRLSASKVIKTESGELSVFSRAQKNVGLGDLDSARREVGVSTDSVRFQTAKATSRGSNTRKRINAREAGLSDGRGDCTESPSRDLDVQGGGETSLLRR